MSPVTAFKVCPWPHRRAHVRLLARLRRQEDTIRALTEEREIDRLAAQLAVRVCGDAATAVVRANNILRWLHAESHWETDLMRQDAQAANDAFDRERAAVYRLADENARLRREVEAHEATIARLRPRLLETP